MDLISQSTHFGSDGWDPSYGNFVMTMRSFFSCIFQFFFSLLPPFFDFWEIVIRRSFRFTAECPLKNSACKCLWTARERMGTGRRRRQEKERKATTAKTTVERERKNFVWLPLAFLLSFRDRKTEQFGTMPHPTSPHAPKDGFCIIEVSKKYTEIFWGVIQGSEQMTLF